MESFRFDTMPSSPNRAHLGEAVLARLGRYCATEPGRIFGAENLGACGLRNRRPPMKNRFSSFGFLRRTNNDGRGLSMGLRTGLRRVARGYVC
jgi:hypothetical protein